ncbi:MAG TPA: DUF4136 domain-containing protein [Candidatus Phocaeicola caecigallinarum]|nr:DUF4136 domain-containing protein [Candidatus Phocaeicola caecigallinarum]
MKKNLFMAFGIIALMSLAACEKDPDMGQLDSDLVVYTDHDNSVDFSKYVTYYLPDSILEAGDIHTSYWTDNNALAIVGEVENQMNRLGYQRITDPTQKGNADVGVQLSYVSQTNTVISGGYWGGWWDPFYWGAGWGGWYYPYPVSYSYDTQALILEMVDLTGQDADNNQRQIPVVWYASASGFQFGSNRVNMQLLLDGVDQAFSQSAYLSTNK